MRPARGGQRSRNCAGKRPLRLPVEVLDSGQQSRVSLHRSGDRFQRDRRREEPHIAVVVGLIRGEKRLEVCPRFVGAQVHLPVRGEQQPSHASSRASTPGSTFPSRNSSDAPPPVDTCENLSSSPATAAAESPPPTIVIAPFVPASTSASATARVPSSNGGVSNTPIGPFQTTVLALRMRARKSTRVAASMSYTAQPAGTWSAVTSRRSPPRSRLGATTPPRGRISLGPPRCSNSLASGTLSRST